MSLHRGFAGSLWGLAAVGAYPVVAAWADAAQSGKLPPWTLVALFWGTALVSVAIHHLSRYLADQLADHLAEVPDTLRRHGPRWSLAVRLQAGRLGRLLLSGRRAAQAVALSIVQAEAARTPPAGSTPSGDAPPSWTLIVVLRSVAGFSAAATRLSNWLAEGQGALRRRSWRQLGPIVGFYLSNGRLLRAAGGQSVALAARLGSLIGVRSLTTSGPMR